MKVDEILDSPELIQPQKKIWGIRIILILMISFISLLPRCVYLYYKYEFPSRYFIPAMACFSFILLTLILTLFIKNINYKDSPSVNIITQCFTYIFIGLIMTIPFHNGIGIFLPEEYSFFWSPISLSNETLKEIFMASIILGFSIPFGILSWLKYKNKWLLPLIIFIFLGLIFSLSNIPETHG